MGDHARSGRGGIVSAGPGVRVGSGWGVGAASVGLARLVLEVLLWLVGRYSEQGVMLHVCKMAF